MLNFVKSVNNVIGYDIVVLNVGTSFMLKTIHQLSVVDLLLDNKISDKNFM